LNNIFDLIIEIINDTGKGLKGYIKSQLILMIITFVVLSIGLIIIGMPWPIPIALVISILDIMPIVGSGIVMVPWSIINFIKGNADTGIQLAILYVILSISRQIIEPKIVGDQIGIRPLYTFAATILGSLVLGPIGVVVGPMIAVIISSIYRVKKKWDKRN
jgi:sporulation integral membrane protein YtvI